jgi:hypothetical protein
MSKALDPNLTRRTLLGGALAAAFGAIIVDPANAAGVTFSHVLGRPTSSSIALSLVSSSAATAYIEFGFSKTRLTFKSEARALAANEPQVFELTGLKANSVVYYRVRSRGDSGASFDVGTTYAFKTAKTAGKSFTFTLQGDTHPERAGKMFNAELYTVAMKNIASQQPDFHILLGDDFSIDPLIEKGQATAANVDKIYKTHRDWLAITGGTVPIFLVNGNHEQAAQYLLDGTETNPAVLAGKSRLKYFPLPVTNSFYSADKTQIEFVGNPRDYYSWTWGDATFITLDPYWHSKNAVDNVAGVSNDQNSANKKAGTGAQKTTDLWQIGIGDEQYAWLKNILEKSKSKYIFVFAHHVMGTGRGAVEVSEFYEWGGKDPKGKTTFKEQRPNWELPIHDLFVKHKVSAFFQGHDHIFVTQQRDGVIYQSMPNPADDTFSMFNADAYISGTKAPNSGHVKVSVTSSSAKVQYFLAARAQDTARKNLEVAHSYSIAPRKA